MSDEREEFYARLAPNHLAPLWEVFRKLITPAPASACRAAVWHYDEHRPLIMEAGDLITAKEAERRVLVLENPGMPGQSRITTTLYAGWQLILPGEVAPAHRHSQSALRFIVEGSGAYTAVDGERTIMDEGDFVITPSWTWHDHGNQSDQPMVWLDGLDIPLVQFLDASFFENYGEDTFPVTRPTGDALARYGSGLLPVDQRPRGLTSPVLNYPYARTREALDRLARAGDRDPCHGIRMQYVNPQTGGYAMPTMATFLQLLPREFATESYRSTDAMVFSVVEGRGRTEVGDQVLDWRKRDTFVIPSWKPHRHFTEDESVLFSFSDRPVQQALGLWRESRGVDGAG